MKKAGWRMSTRQAVERDTSRMTGMRSWTGLTTPFAAVVRRVQDSTGSGPFSQRSHRPAKANSPLSGRRK
jgi:hypothetical protein